MRHDRVRVVRRWALLILVSIVLVAAAVVLRGRHVSAQRAEGREARYQAVLQSYSSALKPGMTRKEVEGYLKRNGTPFGHEEVGLHGPSTLVKIAEEDPPWYCGEHYVYIAFSFDSNSSDARPTVSDEDTLSSVYLSKQLSGCL